ncbi:tRNA G10 N-methylase Trm11 [Nocardia transvalensis]|uniref:Methyltransferase n=1 Tax=Nocardia transvalensis TaxID=37333 RepID=A0A7W9UGE0_9NOCA|nr:DNA methyltransferase [Nocardia transvalensis]MBB5912183.1 tRNA G10 N-methylase Trm11 [Nocardia transvalensis]
MSELPPTEPATDTVVPVSVWATAQTPLPRNDGAATTPTAPPTQRKCCPQSPLTPSLTTLPGDLVLDPMCGSGTTIVEALHLGRRALGVEYESRWAAIAHTDIDLARAAGYDQEAAVFTGDARRLDTLLPARHLGAVDLIITSPPCGDSTHGHVSTKPGEGVRKRNNRYGSTLDRGQLANIGLGRLLSGFTRILAAGTAYLRPGGHVVITARP